MATIIDGKATADALRVALAERVRDLSARFGRSPGLAVVLVGARADSATYVRNKKTACAAAGIRWGDGARRPREPPAPRNPLGTVHCSC